MRYRKTNFDTFIKNHLEEVIDSFISNIRDDEQIVSFLNDFIFEELDGYIPRSQHTDEIINLLSSDEPYINLHEYLDGRHPDIYLEQFAGFDYSDEDADIFLDSHREEFDYWLKEYLKQTLDDILTNIYDNFKEEYIEVFRGMSVDSEFEQKLNSGEISKLGVCWTIDKSVTSDFNYGGDKSLVMTALVHEEEVDWFNTLYLNLDPTLGDAEKEIRLYSNSKILLQKTEFDKGLALTSSDKNELFCADDLQLPWFEREFYNEFTIKNEPLCEKKALLLKKNGYDSYTDFLDCVEKYNKISADLKKTIPSLKNQTLKNRKPSKPSNKI